MAKVDVKTAMKMREHGWNPASTREQVIDLWERGSGYSFIQWKKECHEHNAKVLQAKGYRMVWEGGVGRWKLVQ